MSLWVSESYIGVALQGKQESQRALIFQIRGKQGQFMKIRIRPGGVGQGTNGLITGGAGGGLPGTPNVHTRMHTYIMYTHT